MTGSRIFDRQELVNEHPLSPDPQHDGGSFIDQQRACEGNADAPLTQCEEESTIPLILPSASGQKRGRGRPKGSKNRKSHTDVVDDDRVKKFSGKDPVPPNDWEEAALDMEEARATLVMAELLGISMEDPDQCLQHLYDLRRRDRTRSNNETNL